MSYYETPHIIEEISTMRYEASPQFALFVGCIGAIVATILHHTQF